MSLVYFGGIRTKDCLNQEWTKWAKFGEGAKSSLNKMIDLFNHVANWVTTEIVRGSSEKRRAATIKYFIDVAAEARAVNDFNTVMGIIAALNGSTVRRLKKSWALVSAKRMQKFTELDALMSSASNYKGLRTTIQMTDEPLIPYMGMYLTDLTFVEVRSFVFIVDESVVDDDGLY